MVFSQQKLGSTEQINKTKIAFVIICKLFVGFRVVKLKLGFDCAKCGDAKFFQFVHLPLLPLFLDTEHDSFAIGISNVIVQMILHVTKGLLRLFSERLASEFEFSLCSN